MDDDSHDLDEDQGDEQPELPVLSVHDQMERTLIQLENAYGHGPYWLHTGIHDLDDMTNALRFGSLAVLTGETGASKTAFCLNVAVNVALEHRLPVLFVSFESDPDYLMQRILSVESRIQTMKLEKGDLTDPDWPRLNQVVGRLAEAPIFLANRPRISQLAAWGKKFAELYGGMLLMVVDGCSVATPNLGLLGRLLRHIATSNYIAVLATATAPSSESWTPVPELAGLVDTWLSVEKLPTNETGATHLWRVHANRYGPTGYGGIVIDESTGKVFNLSKE